MNSPILWEQFNLEDDGIRKVHKSLQGVTIATTSGVKDYIPKSFNNVKVYSGVKYQNYNPADVEIRNFVACQGAQQVDPEECMDMCSDLCSGSSCPSNTLIYIMKCGDQCLLDEVSISSNLTASSTCLSCLAASTPASCQSCQTEGTCLDSKMIGRCRNCVFNIYFGMVRCASRMKPAEITNCIAANVHSHCKVCVCWAVCRFGMKSVCNCCRNNKC